VRIAASGAGALLLTAIFVARGFPYHLLAERLRHSVARATSLELRIGELSPALSLAGPGVLATGVRITGPRGVALDVESLRIRPAWSLGWLLLRPALHVAVEVAGGSVEGTLAAGPSAAGRASALDLARLPVAALWPGAGMSGRLDASFEIRGAPEGPVGAIALAAREGSATLPRLPLPLPFESLTARLALGGDALVRVEELALSGPGIEAELRGALARAPSFGEAPLDLRIELSVDAALRAGLQRFGVPLRSDGRASLRVSGVASRPVVE
jgi:type II secretion system protein N